MPFLTIAGITVPVSTGGARETEPEQIGTDSRAFAGNLRTTVRAEKRAWEITTNHMTSTAFGTLRTAVANGAQVTVGGDAIGGTVTCRVRITGATYVKVPGGHRRVVTLVLREV